MFSVETGATVRSVSKTYKGDVDNLLTVIEVVAWELVGLKAPQDKLDILAAADPALAKAAPKSERQGMKKSTRRLLMAAVLLGGGGYYLYSTDFFLPELPEPPAVPEG